MPPVDDIAVPDEMAAVLAAYATEVDTTLDARTLRAAKAVLVDAMAVGLGALRHRAALAARRYAYRFPADERGCTIWGTAFRSHPEAATLANGVLLRCYDYNDLYWGRRAAGHPSDILAGLIAVAEACDASGSALLSAIALGYEVTLELLDAITLEGGWDYANLTALGAACAIARLMRLSRTQAAQALAITVIPHLASDEIESGDLNERGDLTMWKRFNGADAIRQAVYACTLAAAGVEGVVRPFTGKLGFLKTLGMSEEPVARLRDRLDAARPLSRVAAVTMKRWPVGSRGQSAIQAALAARSQLPAGAEIREIRVVTEEGVYDHLVRSRSTAWAPQSRETADHSLPYIVMSAVLDGYIRTDSFAPSRVLEPARRQLLSKVTVAPTLARSDARHLSQVEIETVDRRVAVGEAAPQPGHPDQPFSDADLAAKFHDAVAPLERQEAARILAALWSLERVGNIRNLTSLLAIGAAPDLDSESVE